ncbi:MAG: ABC transporter ATP-binding protein [Aquimonas sp.]|nr:ABC transporter ATP-binding protein [Aquimonas sp.]
MDSLGTPVIARLAGAHKRYGAVTALDGVDLELRRGEVLAVLGSNGAGKSTALGLLTGRLTPDAGEVSLFGADPRAASARRRIGVMLQEARLPETLCVRELVHLFASYYPDPRGVDETLSLAGLGELGQRRYAALSGGQQRRVQFALAICGAPELVFVDEPTTGLDVEARRGFWQVIRALQTAGTSIVLTTHYLEEADALAERVVLIERGRVLAEDTPAGLKARARGARLRCVTQLSAAELAALPEVQSVDHEGSSVSIRCSDSDALVRRLLHLDPALSGIEIRPLNLEDAFLALTGDAA